MRTEAKVDASFPVRIKKYLDKYIVGQEESKKKLAMALFRHIYFGERNPFLIIGPSGCGKSHMFRVLMDCPLLPKDYTLLCFDVSRLTPEGTKGEDPQDIVKSFAKKCLMEGNKRKRGLVYLDEIDKIVMPSTTAHNENIHAEVQFQIMNYIEGEKAFDVNTNRILFVCGGAFTQLDELHKQRKRTNPIGFTVSGKGEEHLFTEASLRDDLIDIGAQKEFLGRITGIVKNKPLTRLQLKALLLHPTRGIIVQKRKGFQQMGLDFTISDETVDWIVDEAIKENLGARSLYNVLEKVLGDLEYDMLEKGVSSVDISKKTLLGKGADMLR